MSTDEKTIEGFAELFHHYHSVLAPDFGCGITEDVEWNELSNNERRRFVAAVRLALLEVRPRSEGNQPNIFTAWPNGGTEGRDCGC
jgi:hypothetical protein